MQINYKDLYDLRVEKYDFLNNHDIKNTDWQELELKEPNYFFVPKDAEGEDKYNCFSSTKNIFEKYNAGIATGKDEVLVSFDKNELVRRFSVRDEELFKIDMKNQGVSDNLIDEWRKELKNKEIDSQVLEYNYRLFDKRFLLYNTKILQRARDVIMKYLLKQNISLVTTKILSSQNYQHIFVSDIIGDRCLLSNRGREANYYFPLYIYENTNQQNVFEGQKHLDLSGVQKSLDENSKRSNIRQEIIDRLSSFYGHKIVPEEIFYYIYAVLYSNKYREKYNEFLKIDFPKVPFTKDYELFRTMANFGAQLSDLHLLKSLKLDNHISKFKGSGDNSVKKVEFLALEIEDKNNPLVGGCVWINENQYFDGINEYLWNYYIGGYQVLNKWLKDRKGRHLLSEEIAIYCKIITSIHHTILIQKEIDRLYPEVEKSLIK